MKLLDRLVQIRPYLYHLTARMNVPAIREKGVLESAERLLEAGRRMDLVRERRAQSVVVTIDERSVHIRDQTPLYEKNCEFGEGWCFTDLIAELNHHVFFWPGTDRGASEYGRRHFARYAGDDVVVLRAPTADVFRLNPEPRLCRYNSGSPRWSGGKPSPRGRDLFVAAGKFGGTASEVVEVVFGDGVQLPNTTEILTVHGKVPLV